VSDRIDLLTGTFGKALGGASGGYVSTHQEIAALVRRRARPYVFSNALPPMVTSGNLCALELAASADAARARLIANTSEFRELMSGFDLLPGQHPIVPVRIDDPASIASRMRAMGVHVTPITFPVVPRGTDRIRVQLSSAHTVQDIHTAVNAFRQAARVE
jgi:glycine C-acetyltransferase